jgi:hypothetical protein
MPGGAFGWGVSEGAGATGAGSVGGGLGKNSSGCWRLAVCGNKALSVDLSQDQPSAAWKVLVPQRQIGAFNADDPETIGKDPSLT